MNCEQLKQYLSEYLDDQADEQTRQLVQEHLASCADCRAYLQQMQSLSAAFLALPQANLPADFSSQLSARLAQEPKRKKKRSFYQRNWFKVAASAAACLVVLIGVVALGNGLLPAGSNAPADEQLYVADSYNGASSGRGAEEPLVVDGGGSEQQQYSAYDMENDMAVADDMVISEEEGIAKESQPITGEVDEYQRKIIKNVDLSLQVDNFDAAFSQIEALAAQYNGFVVNASVYTDSNSAYQSGYISLRVEVTAMDSAVAEIEALGQVDNINYWNEDITSSYYDTDARLEQYLAQKERLTELYGQAATMEDLIALESELSRVQGEIDLLTGQMNMYDQLTSLSLISVNIYSDSYDTTVSPHGFDNFGSNLKTAFLNGINNLVDFFAAALLFLIRILPWLLIAAVVVVVIVLLVRRNHKRQNRNKQ